MNNQTLVENLRTIKDWPIKGVNFRDVTTLFKNAECVKIISDMMYDLYKDKDITKIVGIESRGFVMSSAAAIRLNAGIVLCRKPGKLPCNTIQQSYAKEYGIDTIEIHKDAITPDDVVLLHDDLLATGGTMKAAIRLLALDISSCGTTALPLPRLSTSKQRPSSACHQWACSSPQRRAFIVKPLLSVTVRHTPRLAGTEREGQVKASKTTMSDSRKIMVRKWLCA